MASATLIVYIGKLHNSCHLLLGVGVVKDVVDSPHLDEDGSVAEGVPEASQPDLEVAEDSSGRGRGGRPDRDNDGEIEENGS